MFKNANSSLYNISLPVDIDVVVGLRDGDSHDMRQIISAWGSVYENALPIIEQIAIEEFLMNISKSIRFSFEDGLMLYNAGLVALEPNRYVLGRGAMWVGTKIALDAIDDLPKKDAYKRRVLIHMIYVLLSNSADESLSLSRRDRRYIEIVFGRKFLNSDPEHFRDWILEML
jgi:hypothetical protein